MSAPQSKGKGGTIGIVIMLLVLMGVGVGAALMLTRGGGRKQPETPPPEPTVTPPIKLVEAPPPMPDAPPVVQETPPEVPPTAEDPDKTAGKKKALPMGTIDAKQAQEVTKKNYVRVRACYEKQLKVNNLLQGAVTVKITIFPDGSVNAVKFVDDTVHNSAMNECIRKEILSWQFPKPEGGKVEVHQSYRFEPKAG